MDSEYTDNDHLSEPKVEVKEEKIVSGKSEPDNISELKDEVKEEQMDY